MRLSHQQLVQRGKAVERAYRASYAAGRDLCKRVGCHGRDSISKTLRYVDLTNLWVLPVAHASLFGVMRDFWDMVLSTGALFVAQGRLQPAALCVMFAWAWAVARVCCISAGTQTKPAHVVTVRLPSIPVQSRAHSPCQPSRGRSFRRAQVSFVTPWTRGVATGT